MQKYAEQILKFTPKNTFHMKNMSFLLHRHKCIGVGIIHCHGYYKFLNQRIVQGTKLVLPTTKAQKIST